MLYQYLIFLLLCGITRSFTSLNNEEETVHIVYMGAKGETEPAARISSHQAMLATIFGSEKARDSVRFSYKYGFNGFSAKMTKQHASIISRMPNVVSVFPSRILELHTTRSWDFLAQQPQKQKNLMSSTLPDDASAHYDVIVGVLDTGLWPEAKSFDEEGFGPIPSRWKGSCDNSRITNSSELFSCTRKVIGGRYYPFSTRAPPPDIEYKNARDSDGHGTHTSSTVAGNYVANANLFGLAQGVARGGHPKARVAMYKVCLSFFCSDEVILAAFDDAIHDGVDIISVSIGGSSNGYDSDTISIGSYHAVAHGIVVSCGAGNSGPVSGSLSNVAPWILTVGASTIDRKISSSIVLGNNVTLLGTGLNIDEPDHSSYKLVVAGDIPAKGSSKSHASRCQAGTVDVNKVKGKIVFCIHDPDDGNYDIDETTLKGAAGLILSSDFNAELILSSKSLRLTVVRVAVGDQILSYVKNSKNPTASILKSSTVSNVSPAPVVASFSSRGPNTITPDILKPDIVAPGVNILAAWPPVSPVFEKDNRSYFAQYNIVSGTSMSCPHASGAAAFLKSVYPEWSPAAIKSALMTTASVLDNVQSPITDFNGAVAGPFDTGSGELKPEKAADPGLVYDIAPADYITYLCQNGYNTTRVRLISGNNRIACPKKTSGPAYLNYPSFTFLGLRSTQSTSRTVTNVGSAGSVYAATVVAPSSTTVAVNPSTLTFNATGQTLSYTLTVTPHASLGESWVFGSLTWTDASHSVRSPIAVTSKKLKSH